VLAVSEGEVQWRIYFFVLCGLTLPPHELVVVVGVERRREVVEVAYAARAAALMDDLRLAFVHVQRQPQRPTTTHPHTHDAQHGHKAQNQASMASRKISSLRGL
jgi:hypothetical protein